MSAAANHKLKQARGRLQAGDAAGAQALCEEILARAPRNAEALCLLGIIRLMAGAPAQAVPLLERAAAALPQYGLALEHLGLAHLMSGRFAEAESPLRQAAALPGAPPSVQMRLGLALLNLDRPVDAVAALRRAVAAAPDDPDCRLNLGQALAQAGDTAAARTEFEAALRLDARRAEAPYNLGVIALGHDALEEAQTWFERALAIAPRYTHALVNLGIVLQRRSQLERAIECFQRALAIDPRLPAARNNLARTLMLQGRHEDARQQYVHALEAAPDFLEAREGLASACLALGRLTEGIGHWREVLRVEPEHPAGWGRLADALFQAGKLDEAREAATRANTIDPAAVAPYSIRAMIEVIRRNTAGAIALLEAGLEKTGSGALLGNLTYQYRNACDWPKWKAAWQRLRPQLETGSGLGSPFWLLCEPLDAHQQLAYTRRWAEARFGDPPPFPAVPRSKPHPRLRIGYLSSDFQEHAVAHLVVDVIERHDRDRLEVFIYSYGPDDKSALRARFIAGAEHFVDLAWDLDADAAERIRADDLDLLIDLKGYTAGDRLQLMASRPCTTQLTWLGYPATCGASFIDYVIADPFIIPPELESAYSERVLRMPHCYQPTDRKRAVAEPRPRNQYGLPEDGFVFCCFNQANKITPEIYGVWMRLLKAVPGSVLWLLDTAQLAKDNLAREAAAHGVSPERVIFGARMPNDQHLARYRVADLALDTFPYTSHTTASDGLWCGCPLLGLAGDTFASRVSGSILSAAGVPDLVTYSLPDYEALALRLATDGALLRDVRARVAAARDASPLFDPERFVRDLEALYLGLAEPRAAIPADTNE